MRKTPALTYTVPNTGSDEGLVAGETLRGSLVRRSGERAGTYRIEQGTVDDRHNPNYRITFRGTDDGALTIQAARNGNNGRPDNQPDKPTKSGGRSLAATGSATDTLTAAMACLGGSGLGLLLIAMKRRLKR